MFQRNHRRCKFPAQVEQSRALRVRKTSTKSSRSSSHSSQRSLPPSGQTPDMCNRSGRGMGSQHELQCVPHGSTGSSSRSGSGVSHRGPGSVEMPEALVQTHPETPQRSRSPGDRYLHQQNLYDQRSMHVQIGVDPQQVLQMQSSVQEHVRAIEQQARSHAMNVEHQARTHVMSVEAQAQQVVQAVQSEASATLQETQARAREVVGQATVHVNQVESRANELISQMQSKHQAEIAQLQATANEAHHEAQQQISRLLTQLSVQQKSLDEQRLEQKGPHKTIKALQEEVSQLRQPNELQRSSQNGAGIDVAELMSTIHELRKEK